MSVIIKKLITSTFIVLGLAVNAHATIYTTTFNVDSLIDDDEFGANSTGLGFLASPTTNTLATLSFDSNTNTFVLTAGKLDNIVGTGIYIDAVVFETNQASNTISAGTVTQPNYATPDITSISEFTSDLPNFTQQIDNFDVGYSFNNALHDNQQVTFTINGFNPNCLTATTGCGVNSNLLSSNSFAIRLRSGTNDSDNVSYFLGATIDPASAVPEPETYAMFMVGLGLLGFVSRRRLS